MSDQKPLWKFASTHSIEGYVLDDDHTQLIVAGMMERAGRMIAENKGVATPKRIQITIIIDEEEK